MDKDINKYKQKRKKYAFLFGTCSGILGLSVWAIGCAFFSTPVLPIIIIPATVLAIGSVIGAHYTYTKKWACEQTARQLEIRKKINNFENKDKELLNEFMHSDTLKTFKLYPYDYDMLFTQKDINLVNRIEKNDKVADVLGFKHTKNGYKINTSESLSNYDNIDEVLTTSDNITADVIYQTEKIKLKSKYRKTNNN